jgi:hypothetical protein
LQAIGSQSGPAGGKFMIRTTYIQRLNTSGGSAPASGCSVSTEVGKQTLGSLHCRLLFLPRRRLRSHSLQFARTGVRPSRSNLTRKHRLPPFFAVPS